MAVLSLFQDQVQIELFPWALIAGVPFSRSVSSLAPSNLA
jgi:hypothetical protein